MIFTPVLTKAAEYTNKVKTSIDQSENEKIKYAKCKAIFYLRTCSNFRKSNRGSFRWAHKGWNGGNEIAWRAKQEDHNQEIRR